MKILLVCAAGFSTSMLMKKMEKYWQEQGIELDIQAVSINDCDEVSQNYDVVLLGPQIGYRIDKVKKDTGLPCAVIPSMDYGMGNCANIMKLVKNLYEKK